jgi:hypothetical protein
MILTVATRPNSVSLASATASSSRSKVCTHSTGPKISSRHNLLFDGTSAKMVGATNQPWSMASGLPPPHTSLSRLTLPSAM